MTKFGYLSLAVLLSAFISFSVFAQDETDALRYSQLVPQGTARSMGFGNATGAIGGDFSSLSVNPAGIGVYRTGELMFTPAIRVNGTNGTYLGKTSADNNTRVTINNVGVVFTDAAKGRRYETSKWKATSFGFGINRLADFNRRYIYNGYNSGSSSSSGSEYFVQDANNNLNDFTRAQNTNTPAGLGYQSYLINYDSSLGLFRTVVPYTNGINQQRMVTERGGLNEMVLSFGGNYMEKLMLGATVGIPFMRYSRTAEYSEYVNTPAGPYNFSDYTYTEKLKTKGTGVNLKLGFLYKPSDYFRIGAAVHTPTYYSMSDEFSYSVNANVQGYSGTATTTQNIYKYKMLTPWRGVISAAGFLGKHGFITADYEYVNYKSTRFSFDDVDADYERALNNSIKSMYKGASNFRIGIEGRPVDVFMVRLGFGYYGSAYKASFSNAARMDLSAGVGFRFKQWFTDLGFVHSIYNNQEQPYTLSYVGVVVPTATLKNNMNNVALTIGFKFK